MKAFTYLAGRVSAGIALLFVVACTSLPSGGTPLTGLTGSQVAQDVQALTAAAASGLGTACAFVPTAETITSILASASGTLTTVEAVASAICGAVNAAKKASAKRGAVGVPVLVLPNGKQVPIHGRFIG